jgi:hypothetical protein
VDRKLDRVLQECLERLAGGQSLRECLVAYPLYAAELKPLLETVLASTALSEAPVAPSVKAAQLERLRLAMQRIVAARAARSSLFTHGFSWKALRPLAVVAASLVIVAGIGAWLVLASVSALPGEPLYNVKRVYEQLQLSVASQDRKIELHMEFADKRMQELVALARRGDVDRMESLTQQMRKHMAAATELVLQTSGQQTEVLVEVQRSRDKRSAQLSAFLREAPEEKRPVLQQALAATDARYEETLEALSAGSSEE